MKKKRIIGTVFCAGLAAFGAWGIASALRENTPGLFWSGVAAIVFALAAEMLLIITTKE